MAVPRDSHSGRFLCVPTYPRLRTSTCGCGGGGSHPCPISRSLAPRRQAGRAAFVSSPYTPEDVEEIERDLYGLSEERRGLQEALSYTNAQISDLGSTSHRSRLARLEHSRRGGYTALDSYGDVSERGYEELLEERRALRAHDQHLKAQEASLSGDLLLARRQMGRPVSRSLLQQAARGGVARTRRGLVQITRLAEGKWRGLVLDEHGKTVVYQDFTTEMAARRWARDDLDQPYVGPGQARERAGGSWLRPRSRDDRRAGRMARTDNESPSGYTVPSLYGGGAEGPRRNLQRRWDERYAGRR